MNNEIDILLWIFTESHSKKKRNYELTYLSSSDRMYFYIWTKKKTGKSDQCSAKNFVRSKMFPVEWLEIYYVAKHLFEWEKNWFIGYV